MKRISLMILVSILTIMNLSACQNQEESTATLLPPIKEPIVVFAAGSLIIPFDAVEKAFEEKYPQYDVLAEFHGSIQVMRHATELHEPIDVVATADASLIPMLMYAVNNPDTGTPYADWYIAFSSNHLGLAFTDRSMYEQEITQENWFEVIARDDVRLGLADPRFDAAGYRSLMALSLIENEKKQYTIFRQIFNDQFRQPIINFRDEGLSLISVPEILETKENSHIVLRGASIQLISLLETGDIDYAFEYDSVIEQHNLRKIDLPPEVDLGEEANRELYSGVQVEINFQRFSTVEPVFLGEPITYGITIPSSAPNPEGAELFINYLLGPEGRQIMSENHHPLLTEYWVDGGQSVPFSLQEFVDQ